MRVSINHSEERLGSKNLYVLDCSVLLSEEEKGVIAARGLGNHFIPMPMSTVARVDVSDQKRLYALKLIIAAGVSLFGIVFAGLSGGHPLGGLLFFAGGGYAVWCLYRWLRPAVPELEQVPLSVLVKDKRFSIAVSDPVRAKEAEMMLLHSIEELKGFLSQSTELATRTVREF